MAMEKTMLSGVAMPFCPGCSHGPSVQFLAKALEESNYNPLDVVIVSDIGCCGLVDPLFNTHTIHGLHGRASALAMGVSLGLQEKNIKIIAVQGDGGATIGLQHLLEAARRNLDITLVLLNNQVYGMTGGQISGLSAVEFKVEKNIPDDAPPFDICRLAYTAGAGLTIRVNNPKEVQAALLEAIQSPGFALVEISSMCQQYGVKKVADLERYVLPQLHLKRTVKPPQIKPGSKESLFKIENLMAVNHQSLLKGRLEILIAGSAGGGIQSAARFLAQAGIVSGLYSTMKGEYPITVGTGFSVAEVILSETEIFYTGLETPDIAIIVSPDGYEKIKARIGENTRIIVDKSVKDKFDREIESNNFSGMGGKKGAALSALTYWLQKSDVVDLDALAEVVSESRHADALVKIIDKSRLKPTE